jgi:hypothetical protein
LKSSLDICRIVIVWRPLCREDGSVIYRFCWTSPTQSFSGLNVLSQIWGRPPSQPGGPCLLPKKSKPKLYYDRQSVGQSVLLSGTHLGPANNFFPYLFDYF